MAAVGLAVCLAVTGLAGAGPAAAAPLPASAGQTHQVVTWAASTDRTTAALTDQTVRDIVHTSIGGSGLRVRLSNVFGSGPVTFDDVYAGEQASGAALVPGSNRQVTFNGTATVTIPAGAAALSDPLPGTVRPARNLAVSAHLVGASGTVTGHNLATQVSYVSSAGDVAADEDAGAFDTTITRWFWLDAVIVNAPEQVSTLVTLGNSITDGFRSTVGANRRWPDDLARRLLRQPTVRQFGIANEGISGNQVTADGAGVSALARLDRDVLAQPGVQTMVLLEGINDINVGSVTSADQLIAAYRQIIARAHAAGVRIIGGTLTPFVTLPPEKQAIREGVNEFIRSSGEFDGIIDFDAATRDPANPLDFLPAFDSGDNLHPSDAGYQAMADAIDLALLRGHPAQQLG
jgi:lysophospholipase L1-like esterase